MLRRLDIKLPVVVVVVLFGISLKAFALGQSGRIEGTVFDQAGAKIAGARVALRNQAGVIRYQTLTDDEGAFSIAGVAAGRYVLAVEAPGFSQAEKIIIDLAAGGVETRSVRLDVAAISDKVIVTATRTETFADELGGSVSVISAGDFARAGQSLISERLRLTPGLTVVQTAGRGGLTSVFVRGGESDYNKVLIDGVAVNAAGGLFDFASLTPENVERVEVVRGPRSSLFGSDAMTSVVQLVTRRGATSVPELELSAEGGSFEYHRETARVSGLNGLFDYSASFGFQTTDSRHDNNDFINRSASVNLGFRLAPAADLRITSRWNNNTLGVPGPTSILFVDPDQRQKHRDLALAATLDHRVTARWSHSVRGVYSEFDTHSFDPVGQDLTKPERPPLPPFSFFPDFQFDFREHQKRTGVHYQTIAAITRGHVLTAGLDFEHESGVFTDTSRVSPTRNNLGVYVQDQFGWRERLFVAAGVRLERNSGEVPEDLRATLASIDSSAPIGDIGYGVTANPKVAVSLFARRHIEGATLGATRLKSSFGTGIKEASLLEAFSPNIFFLGNPGLDPERAISFDAGITQEFFNRRTSIELNYFDNRFRDQIIFTLDPVTFGPVRLPDGRLTNFINLERASARGVEVIGAARPLLKLQVSGSYTLLRSRVDRAASGLNSEFGLPLLRRPRHAGSFEMIWIDHRFDITLDGSIVGRRRDIEPVSGSRFDPSGSPIFNDGYAKINAAASYRMSRRITAFARVENLLNQDYEEIFGFPAYRLNFSAGFRMRLGGGK
ncbi:MAG TPA: TonB-dependent receptor [Blastocatellia bacterium]|nr:TonB-dependent receptor [Blastocatellia bacterium]